MMNTNILDLDHDVTIIMVRAYVKKDNIEQVSAWSPANRAGFVGQGANPALTNYRERKNDPLTAVIEGNLKPG
jgi:hypothetical protein